MDEKKYIAPIRRPNPATPPTTPPTMASVFEEVEVAPPGVDVPPPVVVDVVPATQLPAHGTQVESVVTTWLWLELPCLYTGQLMM